MWSIYRKIDNIHYVSMSTNYDKFNINNVELKFTVLYLSLTIIDLLASKNVHSLIFILQTRETQEKMLRT